MKSSVSTVYKTFLISAFVILMSGITCEPETRSLDPFGNSLIRKSTPSPLYFYIKMNP